MGAVSLPPFLEEHGLEHYAATILSSGFDEMETSGWMSTTLT